MPKKGIEVVFFLLVFKMVFCILVALFFKKKKRRGEEPSGAMLQIKKQRCRIKHVGKKGIAF